jgi:hypothetical protein
MELDSLLGVVGIAANIVGFVFVIRQLRMQALATRGETYTSLCGLSYDILRLITEKPFLYDYAYHGKRDLLRDDRQFLRQRGAEVSWLLGSALW